MSDASLHVLFLNTQDTLRADVSVHVSLARALDRKTVRVSVATNRYEAEGDSARSAFESIDNLTLLQLDLGRPVTWKRGVTRWLALLHNLRACAALLSLARWCRAQSVDVIHVTERPRDALFGLLLARLSGSACLIHAHTSYYPRRGSRSARLMDWLLRHADGVVGVSNFTAWTFRRDAGVAAGRMFAVHNAVDHQMLNAVVSDDERVATRQRLGIPHNATVVGSVARLMRGKDQQSLIEALAIVRGTNPQAHLVIAGQSSDSAPDGQGDYADYLVRRADELGMSDAVTFTGLLPHDQMPELFAAFDLFAHPCLEEPFGLVVVEAMTAQRPVVACNAGGIPEIIRDGVDGILVPRRQPAALAEAIVDLLTNPVRSTKLVRSARERVMAAFTPEIQAATMLNVYRRITEARGKGRVRFSARAALS
jgi:glycosyltransferase involved in cell wall biosynthesis